MKITDLWKSATKPTISFELFPARTEKGAAKLETTIDELVYLKPDFVSVTFGAGGSTRQGSHQLVRKLKEEKNLDVMAYFAGYGLSPDEITSVLDDYQALGVENVLVVRGDPPHDESFQPHPESFWGLNTSLPTTATIINSSLIIGSASELQESTSPSYPG